MDASDINFCAMHEAGHAVVAVALGVPHVKLSFFWQSPEKGVIEKFCAGQESGNLKCRGKLCYASICFGGVLSTQIVAYPDYSESAALDDYGDCSTMPALDAMGIDHLSDSQRKEALFNSLHILHKHWIAVRGIAYLLVHKTESSVFVTPEHLKEEVNGVKVIWPGLLSFSDE
jgi:hypothetical protein